MRKVYLLLRSPSFGSSVGPDGGRSFKQIWGKKKAEKGGIRRYYASILAARVRERAKPIKREKLNGCGKSTCMQTRGIMVLLEEVGAKRGRRFRKLISAVTHNHRCIMVPLPFRNLPVETTFLN